MLRKRLIASACFIFPMLGILWMDANFNFGLIGIWSVLTTAIISLVVAGELLSMIEGKTPGATRWIVFLGVILSHVAILLPEFLLSNKSIDVNRWTLSCGVLFFVFLLSWLAEVLRFQPENKSVERVAITFFSFVYAGWLLSFVSAVRVTLPNVEGAFAVFSILFVIKMSDAGAYFTGKKIGKNKLAAVLSPGKTIEGLFGGIVAAVVAAFLAFWIIKPWLCGGTPPSWWAIAGYAISITLVGVFGDLSESMIKRQMGCKDSSAWLPGLGGIMDTADSVILAAPLAYAWWAAGVL